jgi:hypothetical protein
VRTLSPCCELDGIWLHGVDIREIRVNRKPPASTGVLLVLLTIHLVACRESPDPAQPRDVSTSKHRGAAAGRAASGKVAVTQARRKARTTPATSSDEVQPSQDARPTSDGSPAIDNSPELVPAAELPPVADVQQLAAAGIRKLEGTHLTLFTDLPSQREVDELPRVYDAAIAPWCDYFRVAPNKVARWKMTAYVMDRQERFRATGLLPEGLPSFLNGYQCGSEMWIYEQPSAYYRRHMLLHEGTHAFMNTQLLGCGPPWYMEGMAELMGTHRWQEGQLQLAYFPRLRDDVPQWGRIKMIRSEVDAGRGMTLEAIDAYGPTAHLRNEPYAWCWAAAAFLDGHPQFSARFRQLPDHVRDSLPAFSAGFWDLFSADRRQLVEQWQLFVQQLDYGYDLQREAIVYDPPGKDLAGSQDIRIRADRGWQSSGVRLAAGTTYVMEASGRYQIAREPKVWWCEPGGVTIRYYGGRPLGMLLAAVSDESKPLTGLSPLTRPEPIGLGTEIEFKEAGTLFLRINDSPAERADNDGELVVRIRRRE